MGETRGPSGIFCAGEGLSAGIRYRTTLFRPPHNSSTLWQRDARMLFSLECCFVDWPIAGTMKTYWRFFDNPEPEGGTIWFLRFKR